jgi:protein-L-isoaspartate(D-aspartate) O-methyltransferase
MNHDEYRLQRERMVEQQIRRRGVRNPRVLAAMGRVPRERFVPGNLRRCAYGDHPLAIGEGQTISQPYMVALMTELLDPCDTDRVLEVGTGSGYQTAILAELAAEVFTVERIPRLAEEARRRLEALGVENVRFRCGDGTAGWPEEAPFDRIIVTAAAPRLVEPLLDQLAPGGRLVIPVGGRYFQTLQLVEKDRDGTVRTRDEGGCVFVKLIGRYGWSD